jgi:hypothetical protein
MKRFAIVAFLIMLTSPVRATDSGHTGDWYVGLEGGLGVINRFDPAIPFVGRTGFEVGGAVTLRAGLQWRDHIRFDGLLTWQGASIDGITGRMDIAASTANVYYDFSDPGAFVRPYLGVGLGVAGGWLESNPPFFIGPFGRQQGVGMAYLISGGGRFRLSETWTLACAWHFLGTAAFIEGPTGNSINPTMHAFMVGLQYSP